MHGTVKPAYGRTAKNRTIFPLLKSSFSYRSLPSLDPRDCTSSPLKTNFRYGQVPLITDFTAFLPVKKKNCHVLRSFPTRLYLLLVCYLVNWLFSEPYCKRHILSDNVRRILVFINSLVYVIVRS